MKRLSIFAAVVIVAATSFGGSGKPPPATATKPAPERRGRARAIEGRPKRFPHRIWAACDFEARLPNYGQFGAAERTNIPKYPGNALARRATPKGKWSAMYTGMNPVPGPRMGTLNRLYIRYYLKGADTARFQHFSLSVSDNCNIRVTGLVQGRWAETVLNFTEDSRRNDGSPGAFKKGERMDDLKVFVGKHKDGKAYEFIIDDAIFYSDEPGAPPETEPFPNRVMFLAAFDTGTRPEKSRQLYFPGRWALPKTPPRGAYWDCAQSMPSADGTKSQVLLRLAPPRAAGPVTKLRFRGWVDGPKQMRIILDRAASEASHVLTVRGLPQKEWFTRYVNFTADSVPTGAAKARLATGDALGELKFEVDGKAKLYVDEIVLYDAGEPARKKD